MAEIPNHTPSQARGERGLMYTAKLRFCGAESVVEGKLDVISPLDDELDEGRLENNFHDDKIKRDISCPSPSGLLKFTLFPKLPQELREMIWDHTLPQPRIIRFDYDMIKIGSSNTEITASQGSRNNDSTKLTDATTARKFKHGTLNDDTLFSRHSDNATKLPWMILAVDQQSREYAKKRYHLAFQELIGGVYIDFQRDFVFFNCAYSLLFSCGLQKVWGIWPVFDVLGTAFLEQLSTELPDERNQVELQLQNLIVNSDLREPLLLGLSRFQSLKRVDVLNEYYDHGHGVRQSAKDDVLIGKWRKLRTEDHNNQRTADLTGTQLYGLE